MKERHWCSRHDNESIAPLSSELLSVPIRVQLVYRQHVLREIRANITSHVSNNTHRRGTAGAFQYFVANTFIFILKKSAGKAKNIWNCVQFQMFFRVSDQITLFPPVLSGRRSRGRQWLEEEQCCCWLGTYDTATSSPSPPTATATTFPLSETDVVRSPHPSVVVAVAALITANYPET